MSRSNYIDEVAAAVRAATPSERLPSGDGLDDLFRLYGLLALVKGTAVSSRDVHDAWSTWMSMRGEQHNAAVPFDKLSADVKAEDEPFVKAIRDAADGLGPGSR